MIAFKRTDHILINVPPGELASAKHFYQDVLGLQPIESERPFVALWFRIADIELHITEEAGGTLSGRHPAFEIEDLAEAARFLKSKAIPLSYSSKIPGRERLFFRDPFGNRFELIEYD